MDRITQAFESQLRCLSQTTGDVTQTVPLARCLIVWCEQFDDSVQWIPEIHVYVEKVAKGEEGATIQIEEMPDV